MKFIYPVGAFEKIKNKDQPNGYAGLDANGFLKFVELDSPDFENYVYNKIFINNLIFD